MCQVQTADQPTLRPEAQTPGELQLLPMPTMRADDGSGAPVLGGRGADVSDSADAAASVGPAVIRVTLWMDREPDIEFGSLAPWLAAAGLLRASLLMEDMAEADLTDGEEEEEEDA